MGKGIGIITLVGLGLLALILIPKIGPGFKITTQTPLVEATSITETFPRTSETSFEPLTGTDVRVTSTNLTDALANQLQKLRFSLITSGLLKPDLTQSQ